MRVSNDTRQTQPSGRDGRGSGLTDARSGRSRLARRLVIGVVVALSLVVLGRLAGGYLPAFTSWVAAQGAWGPALFILGYVLATVVAIPGSLLTLAAGAIFGIASGVAYVFLGAVIGSSLAFMIARYLARPAVERRLASDDRFQQIDRAIAAQGGKIVFLLRLSPALPYNVLNYALGLTRVRFRDYLMASLGMLPGTLLYVYSGRVAGDLAVLASGAGVERGRVYYLVLAVGLLATATVTVWVTRIARNALRKETGPPEIDGKARDRSNESVPGRADHESPLDEEIR